MQNNKMKQEEDAKAPINCTNNNDRSAMRNNKQNRTRKKLQHLNHLLSSQKISLLLIVTTILSYTAKIITAQQQQQQQQHNILQSNLIASPPVPPPLYQQHNNILHFWVPEGAPINTPLGNIRSADGQLPFLILAAQGTDTTEELLNAAFTFNLSNGDITTNAVLDRETREYYHFVAVAKDPFVEVKCTVTIKDINDNAPMFQTNGSAPNVIIEVPEGQRGIRKPLPLAIDLDTPQYGIKEFRIVSVSGDTPKGTFNLVEHEAPARSTLSNNFAPATDDIESSLSANGDPLLKQQLMDESTVLIPSQPVMQSPLTSKLSSSTVPTAPLSRPTYLIDLEVSQLLDRENQSSYQLVIEVKDGGQPALIGRLNVTVNVLDINDNDPVFTRKSYECQIKEDTARGALLLKVQATDADLDSNGQITYSIKRHSSPSQQQQNLINSNSSDNIEASSTGRYQQLKQQRQQVAVAAGTQQQQVPANSTNKLTRQQGGNEIFEQQAAAQDFTNSNFDSKVSSSYAPEQLFKIDQVKGEVYLAGQLDYETDQLHEFWIEARDHGKPSRFAYASVKVVVINDVSDDIPTLSRQFDNRNQQAQIPFSDAPKAEVIASKFSSEFTGGSPNNFQNMVIDWFARINSSILFGLVLFALAMITLPVCFVKIKSRQPESDYNDTAGLTLTSNNGQTKQSPNHSTSNEHSNGSGDNHHRHHDHQRRSLSTLSSGLPTNLYERNPLLPLIPPVCRQEQLPPTPCNVPASIFSSWPPPGSTMGCFPGSNGMLHGGTPGSTMSHCAQSSVPLDRWFGLGPSSQLVNAQDWFGSYNWDYLSDWMPEMKGAQETVQRYSDQSPGLVSRSNFMFFS